jgi:hypothetical protein
MNGNRVSFLGYGCPHIMLPYVCLCPKLSKAVIFEVWDHTTSFNPATFYQSVYTRPWKWVVVYLCVISTFVMLNLNTNGYRASFLGLGLSLFNRSNTMGGVLLVWQELNTLPKNLSVSLDLLRVQSSHEFK